MKVSFLRGNNSLKPFPAWQSDALWPTAYIRETETLLNCNFQPCIQCSWIQKVRSNIVSRQSRDRQSSFRLQLNSSFLTQRIISPSYAAWHMCRRSLVVERQGFKCAPPKVILTVSQTKGWQWRVEIFLSTSIPNQLTINIASHRCNLSPLTLDCFLWEILNRTRGEIWHKHLCFLLKGLRSNT